MKRTALALLSALALALPATTASAAAPEQLGVFNDWSVYRSTSTDGTVCYALSKPTASDPKTVKRDPIYFLISSWPEKGVKGEPSVVPGYPYKEKSMVTVEVGSDSFQFYTKNRETDCGAWLQETSEEQRLLDAMRRGSSMIVKGTSRRGTLTTDEYSLKGISAALDKMAADCK
ncbi:MAG: hypothetical protein HXY22_05295 [Alphaproteobacteria bacterium]|nr:hypothetical protein [Alphaproteobacteria bacterium]